MSEGTLDLYTTRNYHWYLKQRLEVGSGVLGVSWSEDSETLQCLTFRDTESVLHSWRLAWVTNTSSLVTSEANLACVAVVDGARVLVTPFSQVNVHYKILHAQYFALIH